MKIKTPQNSSKSIENNFESPKDLNIIAAQIQFYSHLQKKNGSKKITTINEGENDHECIMN